ncbi:MAG: GNAT family N-acetyltransferase [Lachnospiraceae bacterium]|nr:GNAT family N-acetyltransferase [Lachnospiraceae bacterium]
MFCLKHIILNTAQSGSFPRADEAGAQAVDEEDIKTLEEWTTELEDLGIKVDSNQTVSDAAGDVAPGASRPKDMTYTEAASAAGTMWITDDLAAAKEYAAKGKPVLGLLTDENPGPDTIGIPYLAYDLTEIEPKYLEEAYRRQAGIPCDILETERCLVRETTLSDADAFYQIYADPSITAHMEDLPKDRDAFRAWLEGYTRNVYALFEYGIWTVCLKDQATAEAGSVPKTPTEAHCMPQASAAATIIGRAGLNLREGFDDPELGFVIAKQWQGQGLAFEVCSAILEHAREIGLPKVIAFSESENKASVKLLTKLGFTAQGKIPLDGRECIQFSKQLVSI